jgi:hypothetical protein
MNGYDPDARVVPADSTNYITTQNNRYDVDKRVEVNDNDIVTITINNINKFLSGFYKQFLHTNPFDVNEYIEYLHKLVDEHSDYYKDILECFNNHMTSEIKLVDYYQMNNLDNVDIVFERYAEIERFLKFIQALVNEHGDAHSLINYDRTITKLSYVCKAFDHRMFMNTMHKYGGISYEEILMRIIKTCPTSYVNIFGILLNEMFIVTYFIYKDRNMNNIALILRFFKL